jgi:hypothetical protein
MSQTTFNVILLYGKCDNAGELFSHDDYDDENKIIINLPSRIRILHNNLMIMMIMMTISETRNLIPYYRTQL